MPVDILRTLLSLLEEVGSPLTRPSCANLVIIAVGWIQTFGTHAVTQALVVSGVAGQRHHEAFHRFFSRGTWDPDELGHALFRRLERWTGTGAVRICVDDTLAPKKGPGVFGIGSHIDAVRSTKRRKVFCFGHCWVVLAALVNVPFSTRVWALPVLFRLYRNKKECTEHKAAYDKKTALAREMVEVFLRWTDRRVELAADSGYCNATVTHGLSARVVLFGAMRPDAVLTAPPDSLERRDRGGRPRKRGKLLPKPERVAQDNRRPWQTCRVFLYGRQTRCPLQDAVCPMVPSLWHPSAAHRDRRDRPGDHPLARFLLLRYLPHCAPDPGRLRCAMVH
jgi:DDE superfamily endonuclease